ATHGGIARSRLGRALCADRRRHRFCRRQAQSPAVPDHPTIPQPGLRRARAPVAGACDMAVIFDFGVQGAQMLLVLLLAPLLTGFTRKVKARLLLRRGPPLVQPYRDLVRHVIPDVGEAAPPENVAARRLRRRPFFPLGELGDALEHLDGALVRRIEIEAGKLELSPESVKLAPLVDQITDPERQVAEKNKNRLVVEAQENLGSLTVDPMRLRQILLNLLSNACKFTKQGEVALRVRKVVDGCNWMEFAVADTG